MASNVGGVGHSLIGQIAGIVRNKVQGAVDAIIGTAVAANIVYRQQLPADRWYFDHKADFKTTKEELQARGWAILHTLEGAVRAAVEGIRFLFTKYLSNTKEGLDKNEAILTAQLRSLKYTAYAIIDPVGQKKDTQDELNKGHFPVGCANDDFHWGNKYEGNLTIPLSFDYNWHPKA